MKPSEHSSDPVVKPVSKTVKVVVLLLILVVLPSTLLIFVGMEHKYKELPFYGPKEVEYVEKEGKMVADTNYFTLPPFAFTDQYGDQLKSEDLEGKVLVVDFFFTRCSTICPKMSSQMQRLQIRLRDPAFDNVVFLSHTVDPEFDTPEVLKKYAESYKADDRWKFVTGTKKDLYEMGVYGYFLSTQEDALAPDGFLHSEMFVLIDSKRRIRGYYDGTNAEEVDHMHDDLKTMMREEREWRRAKEAS